MAARCMQEQHPHIRVLLVSAMVDSGLVEYFPGMELHHHVGKPGFNVEVEFAEEDVSKRKLAKACADAVLRVDAGVLVFLPGTGEIKEVHDLLEHNTHLDVARLHSALSEEEASLAFAAPPRGKRKVILATNVAETSLTLNHIEVVIDSGLRRKQSEHNGVPFMETVRVSGKSWVQRRGRAGRVCDGRMICLYTKQTWATFSQEEIENTDPLWPYLYTLVMGCSCEDWPRSFSQRAQMVVHEQAVSLGLVDADGVTPLGRAVLAMPLPVRAAACFHEAIGAGVAADILPGLVLHNLNVVLKLDHMPNEAAQSIRQARQTLEGRGGDMHTCCNLMNHVMPLYTAGRMEQVKTFSNEIGLNLKVVKQACKQLSKLQEYLPKQLSGLQKSCHPGVLLSKFFGTAAFRSSTHSRGGQEEHWYSIGSRTVSLGQTILGGTHDLPPAAVVPLSLSGTGGGCEMLMVATLPPSEGPQVPAPPVQAPAPPVLAPVPTEEASPPMLVRRQAVSVQFAVEVRRPSVTTAWGLSLATDNGRCRVDRVKPDHVFGKLCAREHPDLIMAGDVILSVNGNAVQTSGEASRLVQDTLSVAIVLERNLLAPGIPNAAVVPEYTPLRPHPPTVPVVQEETPPPQPPSSPPVAVQTTPASSQSALSHEEWDSQWKVNCCQMVLEALSKKVSTAMCASELEAETAGDTRKPKRRKHVIDAVASVGIDMNLSVSESHDHGYMVQVTSNMSSSLPVAPCRAPMQSPCALTADFMPPTTPPFPPPPKAMPVSS